MNSIDDTSGIVDRFAHKIRGRWENKESPSSATRSYS